MSAPRPDLVLLDVNETLSDMSSLGGAFEELGAPAELAAAWFAAVLRDGFALTVVGENPAFAELARDGLRSTLRGRVADVDAAVSRVMDVFTSLGVHPDVAPGLRALAEAGVRLVTLSNGSTGVAEALLERAGLADVVDRLLSVEEAGRWKPAPEAYAYAVAECGVDPAATMLVAVHPWDVDGARRAGLRAAWVNRSGAGYPAAFTAPDLEVDSLTGLAERLRSWEA